MTGPKNDDAVDVEALEELMDEVLETLVVAEQAAAFVEANSRGGAERGRAETVRRQAGAMLDAADGTDPSSAPFTIARPAGPLH